MDTLLPWLYAVMLAFTRFSFGLTMTPLFSAFGVPVMARLMFTLALAILAATHATPPLAEVNWSLASLAPALMQEALIGLLLALGIHAALAAFTVAGRVVDTQLGFMLGAMLDPVSKGHAAVIATALNLLAVVLFFVTDVHQIVLMGYYQSFAVLPLGQPADLGDPMRIVQALGAMFSLGFLMAAPVVVALWLADVVVAVVSRNMPQMNVLFLSIPLKILLGLAVMASALTVMFPVMRQALLLPVSLMNLW